MKARYIYFGLFSYAFFLLSLSFIFQFFFHLHPCPLCVIARMIVFFITLLYAIALLHNPYRVGQYFYLVCGLVLTTAGILVTARHLWLLQLPPHLAPDCSPGFDYLLETLPLSEALMTVLKSAGECAKNNAMLWGITLPAWTMSGFIVLALGQLFCGYKLRQTRN